MAYSFTCSPNLLPIFLLCYWLFFSLCSHSSPWVKIPAVVNHSSSQCFGSLWCFHLPLPVTLFQLLCRPFHFSILHPSLLSPLLPFLSFCLWLQLFISLLLLCWPHATVCVCVWILYVCVYQAVMLCQPHHSCSVAYFPFPPLPAHLFLLLLLHLFFLPTDLSTAALPFSPNSTAPHCVFVWLLPTASLFSHHPRVIQKLFRFILFDRCWPGNGSVYLDVNAYAEWMWMTPMF